MHTSYLPNSDTYLFIANGVIVGFLSMIENHLAAIFVDSKEQGKGIGTKLLKFIKEQKSMIWLTVFKKNTRSVNFYKTRNFNIVSENKDQATGEPEFLMKWIQKK